MKGRRVAAARVVAALPASAHHGVAAAQPGAVDKAACGAIPSVSALF